MSEHVGGAEEPVWPPEDVEDAPREARVIRIEMPSPTSVPPTPAVLHTPPPQVANRPTMANHFGAAHAFPRRRAPEPRGVEPRAVEPRGDEPATPPPDQPLHQPPVSASPTSLTSPPRHAAAAPVNGPMSAPPIAAIPAPPPALPSPGPDTSAFHSPELHFNVPTAYHRVVPDARAEAPGVYRVKPPPPLEAFHDEGETPTAEEFAQRRAVRSPNPVATIGVRAALRKSTLGLVSPGPGRRELELRHLVDTIRRNFGGLRQVTIVNPKGGAGKTVAVLLLAMTFGQKRGGYVLAWDNNETQGTLGMRGQQDFHSRTVRDLMRDIDHFHGAHGRVGDLSQYVRSQGEGMFDVLASDESATAGEMLTADSFGSLREVVSRFYKLIFVDTGNNVRAENWQAAIDATDQLVVTMSARNDSAETAARMLDHLEQNGRHRLVRQAVTVVSMPPSRRDLDVPSITRHFAARTRTVLVAPYERLIDSGEPIRYPQLSAQTRLSWLRIAAAVADGL
jgi:MinD-like ATPase involved in chromosome partitioning or flagellar assembly